MIGILTLFRNVRIARLDISKPEKVLESWDNHYKNVLPDCLASPRCRVVRYEDLVLRPKENLRGILKALAAWSHPNSEIPRSLIKKSQSFETMRQFGYANLSIPPVYGIPEPEVEERARLLKQNQEFQKLFNTTADKS
ncbi:unnamed protein product [Rodentolepis nana]|uniref:Sulfotransferase domain-containing protein n=1 Tax=Rodentolepis nana TaxID=102285 RepID=A0A0R3T7F5_RODNA|nr:unnamed protein product [Rodentolepis nana]